MLQAGTIGSSKIWALVFFKVEARWAKGLERLISSPLEDKANIVQLHLGKCGFGEV